MREETGLTLTDGWKVSIERSLMKGGKKGETQTKRRTRYYSPGGRRFSSMAEAITELRKQQVGGENEKAIAIARAARAARAAKIAEEAARRAEEAEKDTNLSAMTNEMELEETFAIQDLAERVREETGLTLTDGWTVSIERSLNKCGKKGDIKRRTRYYSPGGRRFSSMSEAITELRKQQVGGENEKSPPAMPSRSSSRDAKPVDRLSPGVPRKKYAAKKAARSVVPIASAPPNDRVSALERALDELRGEVRDLRGKVAEQTGELAELRADAACDELRGIVAAQARELADLRRAPSTVWRPHVRVDHIPA